MVSQRCKMVVKAQLEKLGIGFNSIELGEVQLTTPLSDSNRSLLQAELHEWGLELMVDEKAMLIEKIINIIVEMIHYKEDVPHVNFSIYLSKKIDQDYHKVSKVFSKAKGITIEHFIILHKVEKIKELMTHGNLNLTEISDKMHYTSVAHLSRQFKQVTGLTPTYFKSLAIKKRKNLEDL